MLKNLIDAKKKKQNKDTAKNIAVCTTGILAGLAAGMLLAPKSGKETRKNLTASAKELNANIKEKAASTTSKAKGKLSSYLNKNEKTNVEENMIDITEDMSSEK
ncbi:MAG: YtxH domain-containing protein [Clostridium sp.]|uniref:YtxH domain-containing protein n=1 Tax=Clostridium sp. TaxID=1506 RepID=UPI002A88A50B|nr:YtxH domain-containing protein [Clostridium sp.]MDY5099033.1 YtxH domain-containing protein [Clostridium sp.]